MAHRSWLFYLDRKRSLKEKRAVKQSMSALWRGAVRSLYPNPHLPDPRDSMLNLMEGIIPEYDRKGKVRMTTARVSFFYPFCRFEVRLDPR